MFVCATKGMGCTLETLEIIEFGAKSIQIFLVQTIGRNIIFGRMKYILQWLSVNMPYGRQVEGFLY